MLDINMIQASASETSSEHEFQDLNDLASELLDWSYEQIFEGTDRWVPLTKASSLSPTTGNSEHTKRKHEQAKVGGKIIFATDDWFAAAENLLKSTEPEWKEGVFTKFGKWMDGWETRRRRIPGHDWCIIELGAPGIIHGVDIDTCHFSGNFTPRASVQAVCLSKKLPARSGDRMGSRMTQTEEKKIDVLNSGSWETIVNYTDLGAGYEETRHNFHKVSSKKRYTHVRLNMFPDGGIARFRVFGEVVPKWEGYPQHKLIDLAALLNGGRAVGYSNVHYGHAHNVIAPGRAKIMAEGWETARRMDRPAILKADSKGILQVPGNEWAEFKLGHPGYITKIEIDTNHFKGNFPDSCYIEACFEPDAIKPQGPWKMLLAAKKLSAHTRHYYEGKDVHDAGTISHVRLTIAPDGGISRMRLWGYRSSASKL